MAPRTALGGIHMSTEGHQQDLVLLRNARMRLFKSEHRGIVSISVLQIIKPKLFRATFRLWRTWS